MLLGSWEQVGRDQRGETRFCLCPHRATVWWGDRCGIEGEVRAAWGSASQRSLMEVAAGERSKGAPWRRGWGLSWEACLRPGQHSVASPDVGERRQHAAVCVDGPHAICLVPASPASTRARCLAAGTATSCTVGLGEAGLDPESPRDQGDAFPGPRVTAPPPGPCMEAGLPWC